jgi:hypothetical protein
VLFENGVAHGIELAIEAQHGPRSLPPDLEVKVRAHLGTSIYEGKSMAG